MTSIMQHQADLERALASLTDADPRLRPILDATGIPELRRRPPGFAGLAAIVVGQQLSTASAGAIWARLAAALQPFEPQAMLDTADAVLGQLGLSRAKIRTMKAIAGEIIAARLNLDHMATMDADLAHAILTGLPGIGPWTADVYLLFCLGNADAWPAGDLAVQEAIRAGLGLVGRPGAKEMARLAEPWRPFRGAAAHLWWAYYRCLRQRTGTPLG